MSNAAAVCEFRQASLAQYTTIHHHCLHYTRVSFAAEWRFRGPDGPFVVPARSAFASGDGTVLKQVARAGLGLAVLPWFMVAREVLAGSLELTLEGHRRARIGVHADWEL